MIEILPDEIAAAVHKSYEALPKTGKPQGHEWTVLAGIVAFCNEQNQLQCISIGTGTKCLGAAKMSSEGNVVNDCHAEVLARRGFVKVLMEQIAYFNECILCNTNVPNGLIIENASEPNSKSEFRRMKFKAKSSVDFHLYISTSPCGDASIIGKSCDEVRETQSPEGAASIKAVSGDKVHEGSNPGGDKSQQLTTEKNNFTGAKLVSDVGCREDTQKLGVLRIKSGRSNIRDEDRTSCMSCSDKIALWNVVGLEGSLLSQFLTESIFLKSVVIGDPNLNISSSGFWRSQNSAENLVATSWNKTLDALQRACVSRVSHLCKHSDSIFVGVTSIQFSKSKQALLRTQETQNSSKVNSISTSNTSNSNQIKSLSTWKNENVKQNQKKNIRTLPACGYTINWQLPLPNVDCTSATATGKAEVLLGATGAKQSKSNRSRWRTKRARPMPSHTGNPHSNSKQKLRRSVSQLSKVAQFERYLTLRTALDMKHVATTTTYHIAKSFGSYYRSAKIKALKDPSFSSWLVADKEKYESFQAN